MSDPSLERILPKWVAFIDVLGAFPASPARSQTAPAYSVPDLAKRVQDAIITIRVTGAGGMPLGPGTRFFIADNIVATNHYVVGGIESGVVVLKDGKELRIVSVDASKDY